MPLLNEHLSVWEIAFRWEGRDPDNYWLRIPMTVRDRFRTLIDAIHRSHLDCWTMSMEKWRPDRGDDATPEYFIRHWLDQIEDCVHGRRYDRKMLKWAFIERWAMQQWCERQGVPLPEFWFPPGWKIEYEWPQDDEDDSPTATDESIESTVDKKTRIDTRHRSKMTCQQIALSIWAKELNLTIKEIANRKEIRDLGGGSNYEPETVEAWLGEVDPRNPSKKRGRKRKNNPDQGNSGDGPAS